MTYTPAQALAVAMFNAGIKVESTPIGLPTAQAKDVLRYLESMGWSLADSGGPRPTPSSAVVLARALVLACGATETEAEKVMGRIGGVAVPDEPEAALATVREALAAVR